MMSSPRRLLAARVVIPFGLGLLLAAAGVSSVAVANEIEHGGGEVTLSVTIDSFDLCATDAPGCPEEDDGELATTGGAIGVPLGIGIVLTAAGGGIYTLAKRRRRHGRHDAA